MRVRYKISRVNSNRLNFVPFQSRAGEVEAAVIEAINLGYRHIDTAFFYQNEKEIGQAIQAKIKDGTVKREDLFVTTKVIKSYLKLLNFIFYQR